MPIEKTPTDWRAEREEVRQENLEKSRLGELIHFYETVHDLVDNYECFENHVQSYRRARGMSPLEEDILMKKFEECVVQLGIRKFATGEYTAEKRQIGVYLMKPLATKLM